MRVSAEGIWPSAENASPQKHIPVRVCFVRVLSNESLRRGSWKAKEKKYETDFQHFQASSCEVSVLGPVPPEPGATPESRF